MTKFSPIEFLIRNTVTSQPSLPYKRGMHKTTINKFVLTLLGILLIACATTQAQVRITEVNLSLTTNNVEITNFGTASVTLTGWQFCRRFNYLGLTGTIAAGASRLFTVSVNTTASDLGLYNSSTFSSTTAMQDFVQWGSAGNGRESVAVSKGIWAGGTFLALPTITGNSYHQVPKEVYAAASGKANWFEGRPHGGVFPVPDPKLESVLLVGNEWRVKATSFFLLNTHIGEVNSTLTGTWTPQTTTRIDLGSGLMEFRYPAAAGTRQFTRIRHPY